MGWLQDGLDLLSRMIGPGHIGKATVDEDQSVYHWPFATLTHTGRGRWQLDLYPDPNFPRSSIKYTIQLGLISRKDAIQRAIDENRIRAEKWVARQRRKRAAAHEESLQDKNSGHTGKFQDCPACQEEIEKARRRKGR
jgi:hypothetical protein